ncbi:unnamed protein product [Musa acuminata subsp. malaccensis]|uniref:(wild Malaysian banana) hypothetical protein n=1 Tax=Musa acuminata subsp. malaccensis TaxID=214687 RepID=A0A804HRJ2_MUSAM|nr:unnamed protein product [Musa acuminata subsp. malaccensis]
MMPPLSLPEEEPHAPKQFREENLKEGVVDDFKNVPKYIYGLTASQMDMFVSEDNPVRQHAEKLERKSFLLQEIP